MAKIVAAVKMETDTMVNCDGNSWKGCRLVIDTLLGISRGFLVHLLFSRVICLGRSHSSTFKRVGESQERRDEEVMPDIV